VVILSTCLVGKVRKEWLEIGGGGCQSVNSPVRKLTCVVRAIKFRIDDLLVH
jgi:hypothetical protein